MACSRRARAAHWSRNSSIWCRRHLDQQPVAQYVPEATRAESDGLPQAAGDQPVGAVISGDLGERLDLSVRR